MEQTRLKKVRSSRGHERFLGVLLYSIRCYEIFGLMRSSMLRKTGLYYPFISGEKVLLGDLSLLGGLRGARNPVVFAVARRSLFIERVGPRPNAARESQRGARPRLPRQFRSTRGHIRSILRTEMSPVERVGSFLAVGRFLFQVKKWKTIVADYVADTGRPCRCGRRNRPYPISRQRDDTGPLLNGVYSKGAV